MKPGQKLGVFGEHLQGKISRSLQKLRPERKIKAELTPEEMGQMGLKLTAGLLILESVLSVLVECLTIITEEKED